MAFKCGYCNKLFTSKGNLNTHQKTASFCIQIQKTQDKLEFEKTDTKSLDFTFLLLFSG